MALTIDKGHTALLAMDLQNDIVDEKGAFKDFGFALMVKQTDVLGKTGRLLEAARRAGVKVIYVVVQARPGHPEVPRTGQQHCGVVWLGRGIPRNSQAGNHRIHQ